MSLGNRHQQRPLRGRAGGLLLALLLVAAGLSGAAPPVMATPSRQGEQALKARFTIELASFVTFPKPKDPSQPFIITVVGESPFHDELEVYAKGRKIQDRPIHIRYVMRVPEGQACDLLYICRSEWPRAQGIIAWSRNRGILTVSEGEHLAAQGVMVSLLVEGSSLRLGLNQRVLEEERFSIGAQVLQVARILVPSKPVS